MNGNLGKIRTPEMKKRYSESKMGEKNPMYGKKYSKKEKEKMSEILKGRMPWNHRRRLSKVHKENIRIAMLKHAARGESHYRWNLDREAVRRDLRNDPEYKQWRYRVFKRDRHVCRMNNQDCFGKVQAHHILPWKGYPKERYNINNGITLCQAHHPTTRAEEKRLIPLFQGLVSVSNEIICQKLHHKI